MAKKAEQADQETPGVKSAGRVLDILLLLSKNPHGLKLKDMATELDIPFSSLFAILNTMRQRGFVNRDDYSLLYQLSPKVYQIVPSAPAEDDLVSLAMPIMETVHLQVQETVSLSVLLGNEIVFIGKRSSPSVIQVVNALGSRLPAYATASGKVMLANLPEDEVDRILPAEDFTRLTANTITSKNVLKDLLGTVRGRGWATDEEESIAGVWAVAGCILGPDRRATAAMSIVVPTIRMTADKKGRFADLIVKAAADLTHQMNGISAKAEYLGRPVVSELTAKRTA